MGGGRGGEGRVGEELGGRGQYESVWVYRLTLCKYRSVVMVAAMTPSPAITTVPIAISGGVNSCMVH